MLAFGPQPGRDIFGSNPRYKPAFGAPSTIARGDLWFICQQGNHTPWNCLDEVLVMRGDRHPQIWNVDGMTGRGNAVWPGNDRRRLKPERSDLTSGFVVERCLEPFARELSKQLDRKFDIAPTDKPTSRDVTSVHSLLNYLSRIPQLRSHLIAAAHCAQSGDRSLGTPTLMNATGYENPYLLACQVLIDSSTGLISPAPPNETLPPELKDRAFVCSGIWSLFRAVDWRKLATETERFFERRTPLEIVSLFFNLEKFALYVKVREAMRITLEEFRESYSDHFTGVDQFPCSGGFLGCGAIKLDSQKIALISFGDGGIGYALDGSTCYRSTVSCKNEEGQVCDWFGYQKYSAEKQTEIVIPDQINIEIVKGPEVSHAVVFGHSDGWYLRGRDEFAAIVDGQIQSVSELCEGMKRYGGAFDRIVPAPKRDDRSMFAVSGAWFL
jgi:hypothetical protein